MVIYVKLFNVLIKKGLWDHNAWIVDKLGIAIKIQTKNTVGKVIAMFEYNKIKVGKQADSLFEIPDVCHHAEFWRGN